MTLMGTSILGRPMIDVLWWEPGVSADHDRIVRIPAVATLTAWEDETPAGTQRTASTPHPAPASADLVIANEVIQCQADPSESFGTAARALRPEGLMVVSTDLNDGGDPTKMRYLRQPAHLQMWSYKGLELVARPYDLKVDARFPLVAKKRKLFRKRYLLLSRSPRVRRSARRYFGAVTTAPSEPVP